MPTAAAHRPLTGRACGRSVRGALAALALTSCLGTLDARSSPDPAPAPPAAPGIAVEPTLLRLYVHSRADATDASRRLHAWSHGLSAADPRRVEALALAGMLMAERGDLDGAQAVLHELDALAPPPPLAGPAGAMVRAALDARRGAAERAARLLGEAVERIGPDGPALLRLHATGSQARAEEMAGDISAALPRRHRLLALADRLGSPRLRSESRSSLAGTLLMAERVDAAAEMNTQAMAIARAADDPLALGRAWTIEGFLRDKAGDRDGERRAMLAAIAEARRAGSRADVTLGLANLSDHYLLSRDFATALRHAQEALPVARELGDRDAESVALMNIGLALVSMHRLAEGLEHAGQSFALLRHDGADRRLADFERELGGYLERAGYLHEALAVYRRHRELADRVAQRRQEEALLELQERFDGERRREELASLEQENRLRAALLRNEGLRQRVTAIAVGGGVLVLALAGRLLVQLRRQQRRLADRNASLRDESERDPLTGLANRRHVLDRRAGAFTGGLLIVDLDHFKHINDTLGHAAGDATLVEVARRLRASVRGDDLVARWGGEEFLIVTPPASTASLQTLVQRVLDRIAADPIELPQGPWRASASIGFAAFPLTAHAPAPSWDAAVDLVDRALYLAKSQGRNRGCGIEGVEGRDDLQQIDDLQAACQAGRLRLRVLEGPAVTNGPLVEAAR